MDTATVEITTRDGVADAFLARPDERTRPGVLYMMDAFGLRPTIEEMATRIAAGGSAYLDYLERVSSGSRFAITGYCMGARCGWWIAAAHPERVAALAGFHPGGLVTDGPDSPHLAADRVKAELYFGFADRDPSMTAEQIATFERALREASASFRAEVYAGAEHGYTMADSPAFDEAARERHFRELRALLERTLG
jgi:carboxymethylenebutenolidase